MWHGEKPSLKKSLGEKPSGESAKIFPVEKTPQPVLQPVEKSPHLILSLLREALNSPKKPPNLP